MPSKHATASTENPDSLLYSVKEIARKGKVSTRSVRRLIARGEITTHRVGTQIRISEADWQAYLASVRQS